MLFWEAAFQVFYFASHQVNNQGVATPVLDGNAAQFFYFYISPSEDNAYDAVRINLSFLSTAVYWHRSLCPWKGT